MHPPPGPGGSGRGARKAAVVHGRPSRGRSGLRAGPGARLLVGQRPLDARRAGSAAPGPGSSSSRRKGQKETHQRIVSAAPDGCGEGLDGRRNGEQWAGRGRGRRGGAGCSPGAAGTARGALRLERAGPGCVRDARRHGGGLIVIPMGWGHDTLRGKAQGPWRSMPPPPRRGTLGPDLPPLRPRFSIRLRMGTRASGLLAGSRALLGRPDPALALGSLEGPRGSPHPLGAGLLCKQGAGPSGASLALHGARAARRLRTHPPEGQDQD